MKNLIENFFSLDKEIKLKFENAIAGHFHDKLFFLITAIVLCLFIVLCNVFIVILTLLMLVGIIPTDNEIMISAFISIILLFLYLPYIKCGLDRAIDLVFYILDNRNNTL